VGSLDHLRIVVDRVDAAREGDVYAAIVRLSKGQKNCVMTRR